VAALGSPSSRPTKLRVFRREAFDTQMLEEMTKAAHEFEFADELLWHPSSNNSSSTRQPQLENLNAKPRFRREAFDTTMLSEMGKAADEFDFADQLPQPEKTKDYKVESLKKSGDKDSIPLTGPSHTKPSVLEGNHASLFAFHLKQVEELMASMMSMGGHSGPRSGASQVPQPAPVPWVHHPHAAASGLYHPASTQNPTVRQPSSSGGQYSSSSSQAASGNIYSTGGQYSPRVVNPSGGQATSGGQFSSGGQSSSGDQFSSGGQSSSGGQLSGGGQSSSGSQFSSGGQISSGDRASSSGQFSSGGQSSSGLEYRYSSGGQFSDGRSSQEASGGYYSSSGVSYPDGAAAGLQATVRKLQRREAGLDFSTSESLEELQRTVEQVDLVDVVLQAGVSI